MKAFAVITIIALILLVGGGVTAGLIAASEQAPSEPPPQATVSLAEPPQAVPSAETVHPMRSSVAVQQSGDDTPDSDQGRGLTAKPAASGDVDGQFVIPEKTELNYPNLGSTLDQMAAQVEAEPSQTIPQTGGAGGEGETQGTVYTYQDGEKTRRVILQPSPVVRETVADTAEDGAVKRGTTEDGAVKKRDVDSGVHKQPELGGDGQLVFRSESGGELMTLPGGVLLALDPQWNRDAVESFFSRNGIALEQKSELDFLDNGFFVETEPGFPSLELANALVGQDGVILSSPNWAREVELK